MNDLIKNAMPLILLLLSNILTILPSVSTNTEAVKNLKETISEVKSDIATFKKSAEVNFNKITTIETTVNTIYPVVAETFQMTKETSKEQYLRTDIISWSRKHKSDVENGVLK